MFVRFCSSQHVALTLPQNKCICNYKGRNYLGVFFKWIGKDEQFSAQKVHLNPCCLETFQIAQYFFFSFFIIECQLAVRA